jgi:hypothetical protein
LQHPPTLDNSGSSGNAGVWKVFSEEMSDPCAEGTKQNYSRQSRSHSDQNTQLHVVLLSAAFVLVYFCLTGLVERLRPPELCSEEKGKWVTPEPLS